MNPLDNIRVVLVGTLYTGNVGSSCRAMANMGIRHLRLAAPNGKVMTMKSKLAVKVTLPDGTDFVAWECMNTLPSGTMYRSDNERWMYHANGISCRVFESAINPEGKSDYLLVFEGIICEGPKKGEM